MHSYYSYASYKLENIVELFSDLIDVHCKCSNLEVRESRLISLLMKKKKEKKEKKLANYRIYSHISRPAYKSN